jgi:hypothetical protein
VLGRKNGLMRGRTIAVENRLGGSKMFHDSATIHANHERFISRVAELEVVWGLQSRTGFAACPSNDNEERQVLMFWSDRGYASHVKQNHFPEYDPVEISLFDFLFRWLVGMQGDRVLAGTNWNGDMAGREIEPADLRDELLEAMGKDRVQQYSVRLRAALEQQGK